MYNKVFQGRHYVAPLLGGIIGLFIVLLSVFILPKYHLESTITGD